MRPLASVAAPASVDSPAQVGDGRAEVAEVPLVQPEHLMRHRRLGRRRRAGEHGPRGGHSLLRPGENQRQKVHAGILNRKYQRRGRPLNMMKVLK